MPASLENSAVARGLEKISLHPNPKEGQCHLMRREDFLEKTLMLGKCEGRRRRGRQRTRWLDSVIEANDMNLTKLREAVEDRRALCALVHGVTKSQTQLNNNKQKHDMIFKNYYS